MRKDSTSSTNSRTESAVSQGRSCDAHSSSLFALSATPNRLRIALAVAVIGGASALADTPQDTAVAGGVGVLRFSLDSLDADGLMGGTGAKRALDYEFCIPRGNRFATEVLEIDPSARLLAESPGRIGCAGDQWLVIGSTHQPGFRAVLRRLSALPYVKRVEQTFYE